jgi:hypothetical protein
MLKNLSSYFIVAIAFASSILANISSADDTNKSKSANLRSPDAPAQDGTLTNSNESQENADYIDVDSLEFHFSSGGATVTSV